MAWCKTDLSDFSGDFFFPSEPPEFLCVLFNLVVKCSPGAEMLLYHFVAFIVHTSIFCPHFSQNQSANQPNTTYLKSTYKNSGTSEEKKITQKSHLGQSCTKQFNYLIKNIYGMFKIDIQKT